MESGPRRGSQSGRPDKTVNGPVLVIGQGQLGLMLAAAGARLGIVVDRLNPEESVLLPGTSDLAVPTDLDSLLARYPVITAEREQLPDTPLVRGLMASEGFHNRPAFEQLPDRLTQKQLLDQLDIPTAAWQPLDTPADLEAARRSLGGILRAKLRSGGYDGRGQWRLTPDDALPALPAPAIVEQEQQFSREVSLVGARGHDGRLTFFPLVENRHRDAILSLTTAPAENTGPVQKEVEGWLGRIMEALDYVGVMAMELFDTDTGLKVNELAPRVHNSGHWTQQGASFSQFDLHLWTLCGLPVPEPEVRGVSAMFNLIGIRFDPQWLTLPHATLHWYGKSWRAGRKLGHINVCADNYPQLNDRLAEIRIRIGA